MQEWSQKRCATDYYEEFSHFIARRSFHPDLQAQVDYYIEQIQRYVVLSRYFSFTSNFIYCHLRH